MKGKEWIDFSLETIAGSSLQFFQSAHMETHFYEVIETQVTVRSLTARYL
jgi:hypothetical protein